jgi:hypothetical protein
MPGEKAKDEARSGEERLQVAMFITVLDQLIIQLKEGFDDEQMGLLKEMSVFSCGALQRQNGINPTDISIVTKNYGLDAEAVSREYSDKLLSRACSEQA